MKDELRQYEVVFQHTASKIRAKMSTPASVKKAQKSVLSQITRVFATVLLILFVGIGLLSGIRGYAGNPSIQELNTDHWKDNGPFELSPERGRFALLYSFFEEGSFQFSVPIARFAAPDVVYVNDRFASMFAPGVSYIIAPGYFIGKLLGYAQVGSFATVALFALFNVFLLRMIAVRLGAHPLAATIGAVTFLFASPAFAYAVSLYQHHISTFLILLGIYLLMRYNSIWSLGIIWFLCAASVVIDYPNVFMMFPIGLMAIGKIIRVEQYARRIVVSIKYLRIFSFALAVIPLVFFLWFNAGSYGDPLQLSGTLQRAQEIGPDGKPVQTEAFLLTKKALSERSQQEVITTGFFRTRLIMNGLYTHFLSIDRGVIVFTPVMLFAIPAIVVAYKRRMKYLGLLLSVIGINIILYSMWDDPYGGWAFGSRYLIPTYALCGILIGMLLTYWKRNLVFLFFFFITCMYAIGVNTLGAVTTNRNPPKVEIPYLESQTKRRESYTYERNITFLSQNNAKSFVYQEYASDYMSAWRYYQTVMLFLVTGMAFMLLAFPLVKEERYV